MLRLRMRSLRSPLSAWAGGLGLLALLGGCMPVGGVRMEAPDATVDFDAGFKEVTPCARDQLEETFVAARTVTFRDFAEVTVAGNYGGATIMVVDIKDVTPGKARAAIHAHDYMLLWGGPTNRAAAALEKCRNPAKPAAPAPKG
jgi:hypothetical protein